MRNQLNSRTAGGGSTQSNRTNTEKVPALKKLTIDVTEAGCSTLYFLFTEFTEFTEYTIRCCLTIYLACKLFQLLSSFNVYFERFAFSELLYPF